MADDASVLGMNVSSGDVALSGACAPGSSTVTVTHTYPFLFLDRFATPEQRSTWPKSTCRRRVPNC